MAVIKRIGDILIENGMITADQLKDALDKKLPGERVGQTLVRLKYISEDQAELALNLCEEIHKMLNSLIGKLKMPRKND